MPTQCLKTAKKRYEDKVLYYNSRSNKYEILLLELKKKEETLINLHESIDKKIAEKKDQLNSEVLEKSIINLEINTSSPVSSKKFCTRKY